MSLKKGWLMVELICKVLKIGKTTYYRYKKSNEPILALMKYFSNEELTELQNKSKITRLELIKNLSEEQIKIALKNYEFDKLEKEKNETEEIKNEIKNINRNLERVMKKLDEDSFSLYEYEASQNNLDGK